MSESNIPTTIDIDEEFLNEMQAPKPTLRGGWYRAIVTKAENKVSKRNDDFGVPKMTLMVQCTMNLLRDENDADSRVKDARVTKLLILPFPHPELPDSISAEHEAKRVSARAAIRDSMVKDLRACFGPERLPYPPREENGIVRFNGEDIGQEQVEESRREMVKMGLDLGKEIWASADEVVHCAPYIKLDPSESFPVVAMVHELPAGATLVDYDNWWTVG